MSRSDTITQDQRRVFDRAVRAFRDGNPVCIHDAADREGETDLIYPARDVTADDLVRLRNDAGGLVCVALAYDIATALDLPFIQDEISHPAADDHDLGYGDRSSFSVTVNHRETFTGITDQDRALTISELGTLAQDPNPVEFVNEFRIPGHVHLLKAAPNLLADRQGHTELGIALAAAANREQAVVVCEMLDDETHQALPPADARRYAKAHDIPYLEGSTIVANFG
jgi:3,4-dihydroxy 2-butanone 4-phosphate synthase